MEFNRVKIKELSKNIIKADLKKILIIGAIITIISGEIPFVKFPLVITIILFILASVIKFGFYYFSFNKINGKEANLYDVTYGFNYFEKIITLNLIIVSVITIGFILFVIPGIIFMVVFSMSNIILVENPNKSVKECLVESIELTKNYKSDIFIFYISFFVWAVVSYASLGMGLWLLTPYILLSEVQIYKVLKGNIQEVNYK